MSAANVDVNAILRQSFAKYDAQKQVESAALTGVIDLDLPAPVTAEPATTAAASAPTQPAADPTFFQSIAIPLAKRGLKVMPVNGKQAFLPNHPAEATTSIEKITNQWKQYRDCNVAVHCLQEEGGTVIVDVDGADIRPAYEKETGKPFPETYVVQSSPNKYHIYFFQTPKTMAVPKNITEGETNGEFSLRVKNYYVVGEGSIHPEHHGRYTGLSNAPIVPMPDDLLEWLIGRANKNSRTGDFTKKPEGWINDKIVHHDINNGLARIAGYYIQNKNIDDADVLYSILVNHAEKQAVYEDGVTPFACDLDEIRKIAEGMVRRYKTGEQKRIPLAEEMQQRIAAKVQQQRDAQPTVDYHRTELGNAKRLVAACGDDIRFNPEQKKWYEWDGRVWAKDRIASVKVHMKGIADEMLQQAAGMPESAERTALIKWALQSESQHTISSSLALAESEPNVPVLTEQFDSDIYLLNVNNGTLNLRTGEFRDHKREDLLTKIAPVDYDPNAKCPRWEQFLREVMDEETIPFLQRAVGYSLTGFTGEHCFFLLHGLGRNGKSTFLKVLQYVLGDYSMQSDWQSFAIAKNGGVQIRNDIARLHGARFVVAIESEKTVRIAESLIKALTGGDRITARFLYQEAFEFEPQLKLWLATNHKPTVTGTDEAIWSRIKLVPFNVTFPAEKRDKHLEDKLKAEASGILNWALEGLRLYQQDGLKESAVVTAATAQYRDNSDVLQHFLNARCVVAKDGELRTSDLYTAYRYWAGDSGEYTMNERDFGLTLEERGFKRTRISARKDKPAGHYWHGIALNAIPNTQDGEPSKVTDDEPAEIQF